MHIESLERSVGEKEPVGRLSSNEGVSLNNQQAKLLRSRIEKLNRLLAILKSDCEKSSALWKSRPTGLVAWTTPTLRRSARPRLRPSQAAQGWQIVA